MSLFRPVLCRGLDEQAFAEVLLGFSCWPPSVPRIVSAIKASGRYDCRVQNSIYQKIRHNVEACLAEHHVYVRWTDA